MFAGAAGWAAYAEGRRSRRPDGVAEVGMEPVRARQSQKSSFIGRPEAGYGMAWTAPNWRAVKTP